MTLSWDRVARIAAEASLGLEEADRASVARVWARLQPLAADVVSTYKAIRPLLSMLQSDLVRLGPGQEREVGELVGANAYSVIRAVTEGMAHVEEILSLTGMDTVLDSHGWELIRNFRVYCRRTGTTRPSLAVLRRKALRTWGVCQPLTNQSLASTRVKHSEGPTQSEISRHRRVDAHLLA